MKFKACMIGMGKLGLPCAEVFAMHHDVVGFDIADRRSETVPILPTLAEAVRDRDLIFVAIETPHDAAYGGASPSANLEPKDFDYRRVASLLQDLNKLVKPEQLIVLISTVLPGTCRKQLAPLIDNCRFIYNPYLIAMGSVKWDLVHPEMMIVGTKDGEISADADLLKEFYAPIVPAPRYAIGTWDEAECIKIFYNTFISVKIGVVNMIMDVAERSGNINVDVVTNALKLSDQRIVSTRYMTAGMGDGGPCHPRDNIALRHLATNLDLGYDLFQSIIESRERQAFNLAKVTVDAAIRSGLPIVISGKSYKPGIPFVDGSYSLLIAHYIAELGHPVTWADPETGDMPHVTGAAVHFLAHNATVAYPVESGMPVTTNTYVPVLPGSVVIDPWRTFPARPGVTVIPYGNSRLGSDAT